MLGFGVKWPLARVFCHPTIKAREKEGRIGATHAECNVMQRRALTGPSIHPKVDLTDHGNSSLQNQQPSNQNNPESKDEKKHNKRLSVLYIALTATPHTPNQNQNQNQHTRTSCLLILQNQNQNQKTKKGIICMVYIRKNLINSIRATNKLTNQSTNNLLTYITPRRFPLHQSIKGIERQQEKRKGKKRGRKKT